MYYMNLKCAPMFCAIYLLDESVKICYLSFATSDPIVLCKPPIRD